MEDVEDAKTHIDNSLYFFICLHFVDERRDELWKERGPLMVLVLYNDLTKESLRRISGKVKFYCS
jgi:hypothetical protein